MILFHSENSSVQKGIFVSWYHYVIPSTKNYPAVIEPSMLPSTPLPGHLLPPPPRPHLLKNKDASPEISIPSSINGTIPFSWQAWCYFSHLKKISFVLFFPQVIAHFSSLVCSNPFRRSYIYLLWHFQFLNFCSLFNSIHSGFRPHQFHCHSSCPGHKRP